MIKSAATLRLSNAKIFHSCVERKYMQTLLLTLKPKEYNALFHTVSAECAAITLGVAPS